MVSKKARLTDGVGALIEKVEQANRLISVLEEARERFVRVIGHTCPTDQEVEEVVSGDQV